jgi:hypothetical protein
VNGRGWWLGKGGECAKRIDAEIDGTNGSGGCNLGCANCHHVCETLPRSKVGKEKWDALMAEPIRKRV